MRGLILFLLAAAAVCVGAPPPECRLGASEVRFSAADLALRDALADVAKSGNQVEFRSRRSYAEPNPKLTGLPTEPLPFWKALDLIASQARLRPKLHPAEGGQPARLELTKLPYGVPQPAELVAYDGPFRVAAASGRAAGGNLETRFLLLWEPALEPIWLRPGTLRVRGAGGPEEHLTPVSASTIRLKGLESGRWSATLPPAASDGFSLEGEAELLVSPRPLALELPSLAAGAETARDGVTLRLTSVARDPDRRTWTVQALLAYPPCRLDLESHQAWALGDLPAALVGEGQNPPIWPSRGASDISIDEGRGIRLTYVFRDVPQAGPKRLRVTVPAPPVSHRLRFSFPKATIP